MARQHQANDRFFRIRQKHNILTKKTAKQNILDLTILNGPSVLPSQVYRGPNTHHKVGYDYFAPWVYYNTQPEDAKKKKYHH